jgi:GntR family transcriptional regulator/MocR family aminotransferase
MVLPEKLLARYRETISFYSCTVSAFEQRIICSFIQGGYYERHLSKMRNAYRKRRDVLIDSLSPLKNKLTVSGHNSGLHLLLRVSGLREADLVLRAAESGVRVYPLSSYYFGVKEESNTVVLGFAGYDGESLKQAAALLVEAWRNES